MQNCFLYPLVETNPLGSITQQIKALASERRILRVVIFGASDSRESYLECRAEINKYMEESFPIENRPLWSYVTQPPFEAQFIAEAWWVEDEEQWQIEAKSSGELAYISMCKGEAKRILIGGLNAVTEAKKIYDQSTIICNSISEILEREQMPIDSIVRQWNYIERITFEDAQNQHYQEFNDARSELYSRCGWADGYPAATGIGALAGGITIDVDASVGEFVRPIDNGLQVAAHAYSEGVLIGELSQKTTPKFERAKLLDDMLYVSGTAAIRGEESLVGVSAAEQTRITLENIDVLLNESGCQQAESLRVYIKYKEDFPQIKEVVEAYAPGDAIYLFADICRDELLVEIESIAHCRD